MSTNSPFLRYFQKVDQTQLFARFSKCRSKIAPTVAAQRELAKREAARSSRSLRRLRIRITSHGAPDGVPHRRPHGAHMVIMVRYLARRVWTNGAQNMAGPCQELMQYSWPGCLDTRLRGETAIRESHYYLITPGSGVVQVSLL